MSVDSQNGKKAGVRAILALVASVAGLAVSGASASTILVADNFNNLASATNINGRTPTTNTVNANKWAASTLTFNGDGAGGLLADTNQTLSAAIDLGASFLANNPAVYDLSMDVTEPAGGNTNSAWVAVGFEQTSNSASSFVGNNAAPWVLYRDSGATAAFGGPANTVQFTSPTVSTSAKHNFDIRLDTTGANWTAALLIDGVQQGSSSTYSSNPTASRYIGIATGVNGTGQNVTVDNFQLTTSAPEPASLALLGLGSIGLLLRRRYA